MIKFEIPTDSQMLAGIDIPIEGLGITMRTPRAKEILMLGETNYVIALQIFQMDKKSLKIESTQVTNWMIFNKALKQKIEGVQNLRTLMTSFLQLFFVNKIVLGPNSIIIQDKDEIKNIEPEDFDSFQQVILHLGCSFLFKPSEEKFNPKNKLAAQIAEKMKKARARLAKVKAAENGTLNKPDKGLLYRYLKFVSTATPNSMEQAINLTLFQLHTLTQTGLAKEAYELEIKSRLAGAKNDKPLVHWLSQDDSEQDDNIGTI